MAYGSAGDVLGFEQEVARLAKQVLAVGVPYEDLEAALGRVSEKLPALDILAPD